MLCQRTEALDYRQKQSTAEEHHASYRCGLSLSGLVWAVKALSGNCKISLANLCLFPLLFSFDRYPFCEKKNLPQRGAAPRLPVFSGEGTETPQSTQLGAGSKREGWVHPAGNFIQKEPFSSVQLLRYKSVPLKIAKRP